MSLLIPIDFLHRLHHYTVQFLPNEVSALLIGARYAEHTYITDYVHPVIVNATPRQVEADLGDVFCKAERYYAVGYMHTHPSKDSNVNQSDADIKFHAYMMDLFHRKYGRKAYFMIYAPCPGIFALYDGTGSYEDYEVINGQSFLSASSG